MPNTDFYFYRFHVTVPDNAEKLEVIRQGLNTKATTHSGEFRYKFLEVEFGNFEDEDILIGSLVKYDPNAQDEVVNEASEVVDMQASANRIVARSKFILHLTTNVLVLHENGSVLKKHQIVERFKELFSENTGIEQKAITISPVDQQTAFIEEIQKFTKIKKVVIQIVPSNPHFSQNWEQVDKDIKARNIDKYTEIQESKKNDESIILDDETQQKLSMAEDGYGNGTVVGEINGEPAKVSTSDAGKQIVDRVFVDPKDTNQSLVGKLIARIRAIGARANP